MHSKVTKIIGLLIVGIALVATVAAAQEPIRFGALLDFTGPVADLGPKYQAGIELALEEVGYEVAGRPIELIIEDSATSVGVALDKFKKLVDSDGVNICIGPLMGDAHLAIAPYASESNVLCTSLVNGMGVIARNEIVDRSTYLIYPTTVYGQTYWFGQYCHDVLGYETMITVGANYAGKIGYTNGVSEGFKAAGGIVTAQMWTPLGTADYSPYISTMVGVDVDVVMYALEGPGPVARFLYQAAQAGLESPMVTITQDADYTPESLAELQELSLGIPGEATYSWQLDNPENEAFVAGIMANTGQLPTSNEQNAYTITKIILAALEATCGDDSFDVLWPAVLAVELDTPAGPVHFTPEGVAVCPAYVTEAELTDGEYVLSAPLYVEENVLDPTLPSSQQ